MPVSTISCTYTYLLTLPRGARLGDIQCALGSVTLGSDMGCVPSTEIGGLFPVPVNLLQGM